MNRNCKLMPLKVVNQNHSVSSKVRSCRNFSRKCTVKKIQIKFFLFCIHVSFSVLFSLTGVRVGGTTEKYGMHQAGSFWHTRISQTSMFCTSPSPCSSNSNLIPAWFNLPLTATKIHRVFLRNFHANNTCHTPMRVVAVFNPLSNALSHYSWSPLCGKDHSR